MTAATDERTATPPRTYSFGAGHAAALWLGLGLTPLVTLAVALLLAVLLVAAGGSVVAAVAVVGVAASVALPRVGRRPLLSWLAVAATHALTRAAGMTGWVDQQALEAPPAAARVRLPREYGRLELRGCPDGDVGLVVDAATRTATVMFTVSGIDRFPLLDAVDQDELIDGWGQALAILADTDRDLLRVQLLDRLTTPDVSVADPAAHADAATRSRSVNRDTLLVAAWRLPRDAAATGVTAERCRAAATALLTARLLIRPLSTAETAAALARTLTPAGACSAVAPLSRRIRWGEVVTGDTLHRSYLISGWPATPVPAGWLIPLLLCTPAGATRSLAVHLQPLPPAEAARIARAERARAQLDRVDRARLGLTPTASVDRAEASSISLDDELAAGYRTHRLSGVLTVSAPTAALLDAASTEVVQAAAAARLELTALHGQHHLGLAATAPLCRIIQRSTR